MKNQQSFSSWISDLNPEIVATIDQPSLLAGFKAACANPLGIVGLMKNTFLVKSGDGYVSWRGNIIEHYSFQDKDDERAAAALLSLRCLIAEGKGFPVTCRTTSSYSSFVNAPSDTPWVDAMLKTYTAFADANGVCKCLILFLPNNEQVAVEKICGEIVLEFCVSEDRGAYQLFHQLQNRGLKDASSRLVTHDGFVRAMAQAGIAPEDVSRVLNADYAQTFKGITAAQLVKT